MKPKDWTIKDKLLLKKHYYTATDEELLKMFPGRTMCGIYSKALSIDLQGKFKYTRNR